MRERPPTDHRSVQGKQELIALLGEFESASMPALLLPYFDDHSDDVQCAAIQALAKYNDDAIKNKLKAILGSETHSARVLRLAASAVEAQKFLLTPIRSFLKWS